MACAHSAVGCNIFAYISGYAEYCGGTDGSDIPRTCHMVSATVLPVRWKDKFPSRRIKVDCMPFVLSEQSKNVGASHVSGEKRETIGLPLRKCRVSIRATNRTGVFRTQLWDE
jgi:hypothetical protein